MRDDGAGRLAGVRQAVDSRPDLTPLQALAATHRTLGEIYFGRRREESRNEDVK